MPRNGSICIQKKTVAFAALVPDDEKKNEPRDAKKRARPTSNFTITTLSGSQRVCALHAQAPRRRTQAHRNSMPGQPADFGGEPKELVPPQTQSKASSTNPPCLPSLLPRSYHHHHPPPTHTPHSKTMSSNYPRPPGVGNPPQNLNDIPEATVLSAPPGSSSSTTNQQGSIPAAYTIARPVTQTHLYDTPSRPGYTHPYQQQQQQQGPQQQQNVVIDDAMLAEYMASHGGQVPPAPPGSLCS